MRWRIGLGEDSRLGGSQVESVRAVASSYDRRCSAARSARGARPLDLKEESDCSVLEQAEGGILEAGESLSGCYFLKAVRETRSSVAISHPTIYIVFPP